MGLVVATINDKESADDRRAVTPHDVWTAIRDLECGPRTAKTLSPFALHKDQSAGGAVELCETTSEKHARVMVASLGQTFSQTGTFDEGAVYSVPLRSCGRQSHGWTTLSRTMR
jgi:hypothetical protein